MSKSCDTLRRFDSYLMCLALVVSILWNFEDLKHYIKNMCKTMLEKTATAILNIHMTTKNSHD